MHGVSAFSRQTLSVYSVGQDKRKMSLDALTKLQQKERHTKWAATNVRYYDIKHKVWIDQEYLHLVLVKKYHNTSTIPISTSNKQEHQRVINSFFCRCQSFWNVNILKRSCRSMYYDTLWLLLKSIQRFEIPAIKKILTFWGTWTRQIDLIIGSHLLSNVSRLFTSETNLSVP